jgi:adenylate kinase
MNIIPSAVFMFEGTEDESIRRLGNRRVDPNTGDVFNLEVNPPSDESTSARLVELPEDTREVVEKRFNQFKLQNIMLEESFREVCQNMNSEKTIEEMTD